MPWKVVERKPEDLEELIRLAKSLRNPHAEATTGADLQVPTILTYLERHSLRLQGTEVVDIGFLARQGPARSASAEAGA